MQFEKGYLYHIYNQGNNRQRLFFNDENYLFFLKKIKTHVAPFADILAWCLMPNHFHLMIKINHVELPVACDSQGLTSSQTLTDQPAKLKTLNESIGVMLRSYTRAINKQQSYTGTLFRKATKAECLDAPSGITPSFYNSKYGTIIHLDNPEKRYPLVCFNYIHQNPVKAKLVKTPEEWEFSSYCDVIGLRNGTLINRKLIDELELLTSEFDLKSSTD